MDYKITILKGDGIGPEIVNEGIKIFDKIGKIYKHNFIYERGYLGGESIDKYGVPLSEETIKLCKESDSVLLDLLEVLNGMILILILDLKKDYYK